MAPAQVARQPLSVRVQPARARPRMELQQGWGGGRSGRVKQAVREREFREYAEACQARLRRAAFLLCGDWHQAQDLTQTTLMKLYAAWGRVRRDGNVDAYARTILTRTFIDQQRKGGWREESVGEIPEVPVPATGTPELRLLMKEALMTLAPRYRAVLVLRYWEDWTVEETAHALQVTPGTVKSQSARGLARLRQAVENLSHETAGR